MNMESLLVRLEAINAEHPGSGISIDVFEKGGRIEECRIEVFLFPPMNARHTHIPPIHIYLLKRIGFDRWQRKTIRGG